MPNSLFPGAGSNELRRADQVENTHEEGFTYADEDLLNIFENANDLWRQSPCA